MKAATILILALLANASAADTGAALGSPMVDAPVIERAPHNHFFTSGLRASAFGFGPSIGYGHRIGSQFLVGGLFQGGQTSDNNEGGSLDNSQYYKDEYKIESTMLDLNATYFFRENGYGRWGFLVRGGIGHAQTTVKNNWKRYDRDPGFIVIGDEKRLRESSESERSFSSTYARLGGYYQFLWGFNPGDRVGHALELGVGAIFSDKSVSVGNTKPNGETFTKETSTSSILAEVNYSIAF